MYGDLAFARKTEILVVLMWAWPFLVIGRGRGIEEEEKEKNNEERSRGREGGCLLVGKQDRVLNLPLVVFLI